MWYKEFFIKHRLELLLAVLIGVFVGYFSTYQLQRHRALETNIDLANMEQTIWNTLHGNFMRSTIYPTTGRSVEDFTTRRTESRLGAHVQPLLLLLLLPYAVIPRSETLLVLMSLSVSLGAIPVFRLARRRFARDWMGLLFALGYLLLPMVETNAGWDPHGLSFLPTFLLLALDAAESGQRGWWWVWTLLAMGCREDTPFLTGWAMFWMAPRELRKDRIRMLGLGFVLSLLYFTVVIPFFGGGGSPYISYFLPLGTELTRESITTLLRQPAFWWAEVQNFVVYNVRLGVPLLFLYLLSGRALMAMAPMLVLNGLSWYAPVQSPHLYHYAAPIVPWALVGVMDGFLIVERTLRRRWSDFRWRVVLSEALLVSIVATHVMRGYTPLSVNFDWPKATPRDATLIAALAQVPQEATLSADVNLAAHLSRRETLRFFHDMRDVEWVALNFWLGWDFYGGWRETWLRLADDPGWQTVDVGPGWILLRRGQGPPAGTAAIFSPPDEIAMRPLDVVFCDGALRLTSVGVAQAGNVICSTWENPSASAATPWLAVSTGRDYVAFERPLKVARFAPQLVEAPAFEDCTNLSDSLSGDARVQVFVLGSTDQHLPITTVHLEAWGGDAEVVNRDLVLNVSD